LTCKTFWFSPSRATAYFWWSLFWYLGELKTKLREDSTVSKLTFQELESHLWKSSDILRGSIDSSDYKNYIFGLLFLKRLSDVSEEQKMNLIDEHGEELGTLLADDPEQYQFFVPNAARWEEIRKHSEDIGSVINIAFESLENENKTLEGVLTPVDFNRKEVLTDNVLQRLLQHFSLLDLRNSNLSEPDMLGRAYEYLIKMFADDSGKKGGEFYTPSQVVELIVKLIKPEEGMRVYDPTCGSGGMLIQSVTGWKSTIIIVIRARKELGYLVDCKDEPSASRITGSPYKKRRYDSTTKACGRWGNHVV